jgi:UDP-hydrolysing UDP-N-acetyl-D-glucosamine 2-epimerase
VQYVILANNRATLGRTKALYDEMQARKLDVHAILGCTAWDSSAIATKHRIQALMAGDDNESMALTTCAYATQLPSHLREIDPDYALIHGDRYEQLGAALICSYMGIPIIHTEGGDVSGCLDDKVRYAITALADVHFPVTEQSAVRLREIVPSNEIVEAVGSTGIDLVRMWEESHPSESKKNQYPYVLVLQHPNTTSPEDVSPLIHAVLNECGSFAVKWVNANVDAGAKVMMKEVHKYDVEFVKNLPPGEFFALMRGASLLIGNSSSFIKEASYLGKRAVIVGGRQNGREVGGNVIWSSYLQKNIEEAISNALQKGDCERSTKFGDGYASRRICNILEAL